MKVTIEISEKEFKELERYLSLQIGLAKIGFVGPSVTDEILLRVFRAAKKEESAVEEK